MQTSNKTVPGRQLSKAERYRWIIQDPKPSKHIVVGLSTNEKSRKRTDKNSHRENMAESKDDLIYNHKLSNSIVKGASDFKCKHCGASYVKLEELTKHMYIKGHYIENDENESKGVSTSPLAKKTRKISSGELGDQSAAKVLSCLRCGASFESLQDLTCHMVKTRHHETIPMPGAFSRTIPNLKANKSFSSLGGSIGAIQLGAANTPCAASQINSRLPNISECQNQTPLYQPPLCSLPYTKGALDGYNPALVNLFPFMGIRPPLVTTNWSLLAHQQALSNQHQVLAYFTALQAQKEEERITECKSNSSDDTVGRLSRNSVAADYQNETQNPLRVEQNEPLDLSRKRHSSSPSSSPGPSKLIKCESPMIDVDQDQPEDEINASPNDSLNSNCNNSIYFQPTSSACAKIRTSSDELRDAENRIDPLQCIRDLTVNVMQKFESKREIAKSDNSFRHSPIDVEVQNKEGSQDKNNVLSPSSNPITAMENLVKSHTSNGSMR